MTFLLIAYAVVGLVAYFWYAPRHLKRKRIKPPELGWTALNVLFADISGILVLFVALAIWPLAVPLWLWMEIDAKKKEEEYAELLRRDREAKASDKYYGMSLDQKLEALAQKVQAFRKEEPNSERSDSP